MKIKTANLLPRLLLPVSACLAIAGCDERTRAVPTVVSPEQGTALKQKQADFLNRIREADPNGRTFDRAVINEDNELGLILDRSVALDRIPDLMRTMLTQMAVEFSGQNLTVIAYTPSSPPRKIGIARLDAATRQMTYTAEPNPSPGN